MIRRLPKRGFTNIFKKSFQIVNISDINELAVENDVIDADVLCKAGKVRNTKEANKVLRVGELEKAVTVKADAFSKSAVDKISKVNGKVEVTARA